MRECLSYYVRDFAKSNRAKPSNQHHPVRLKEEKENKTFFLPVPPYAPPVALYNSRNRPSFSISCTVMSTVPPPQSTTM